MFSWCFRTLEVVLSAREKYDKMLGWDILKQKFKYPVLIEKVIGCEEPAEKQ